MMKKLLAASVAAIFVVMPVVAEENDDPYLWLEDVEGGKALTWVKAQNERSQGALEALPFFDELKAEALGILNSDSRIAYGNFRGDNIYNFWQDDKHVRGIWRRSDIENFRKGEPKWEIVLDFDKLATDEKENWIRGDTVCLSPENRHCMIEMSHGGSDAAVWREFDTVINEFVAGGFEIPEAKSSVEWFDKDMLIVGSDFGEGSLTDSGYSRTLKAWRRGDVLVDSPTIFEGEASDVAVAAITEHDGDKVHLFIMRALTFFEYEYTYVEGSNPSVKLPVPLNNNYKGVIDGRAIFFLREDWPYQGKTYPQGAAIAYTLADGTAELVLEANETQSIEDVGVGKKSLVVQYLDDVSGNAARLTRKKNGTWIKKVIELPKNGVVSLVSVGGDNDDALFSYESMTSPDSLYSVTGKNKIEKITQSDALYDAKDVVVEQRFAKSADGTKIPYFIMAQKDVLEKGDAPTIQYGYGGFLISILPNYYSDPSRPQHGALAGKMWVSRGGVLVISNIRGGSEYGPRWHEAALKGNRQKGFDDFIAIGEDLVATGVTSPEKLGAIGRSNGGLLMGAMLTQRPKLYAALDIGVPLLDMKRYNKLLAGASWMGEYGNPDIDEEWAYISDYSPYQLIEADKGYPKVLFYTSTKDDRVHPGHARKAAAKLEGLGYDFYYYENIEGGHGGTANQDQLAYRTALEYAYFMEMLMGEEEPSPVKEAASTEPEAEEKSED